MSIKEDFFAGEHFRFPLLKFCAAKKSRSLKKRGKKNCSKIAQNKARFFKLKFLARKVISEHVRPYPTFFPVKKIKKKVQGL